MDKLTQIVAKTLKTDAATASGILVASFVGLITVLLIFLLVLRRRSTKGNTVLLVGLSDAGKTLMFRQFVTGHDPDPPETYTSIKENISAEFPLDSENGGKPAVVKFIDFPGADKLRKRLFDQYLSTAGEALKAVVYVVDSATFPKLCKDAAELLYDVICDSAVGVPILVACNKQDMPLAKSSQVNFDFRTR